MRAIWSGAIGFGLVNIPVKLYSATQGSELNLDMLDKKDHAKIRFKRVNETTGKEVQWGDIIKAYKVDDKYVELSDKDFAAAAPAKSKTIEIVEFVNQSEIDSIYYEVPYYLEPEKSGVRAYALLREALAKSGMVGVSSFVMRTKESLAILKPMDEVIVLNRIRFEEEIRSHEELHVPEKTEVKPAELKMAMTLIDQLSGKFDISQYKDNYSAQLMKVIEAKAKGVKPKVTEMKVVHSKSQDLMEQLKASLGEGKKKRKAS
ncbi:MAG TPA: Ku protein [Chitinophagales bacterium]|nr:Ku protein [Chitinophagales bacterium]